MMVLLILALFVVSGDVFFVFHVEDFTIRLFQLLIIPVIFVGTQRLLRDPRLTRWPLGIKPLLVWLAFMLLFIPNTTYVSRSVGYVAWLILNILLVIGLTGAVNTERQLRKLLRWYTYSYLFCAIFGLFQLLTPLVGFPGLLVQEWWFPGMLARINGFSYEPSYYATYLLAGWVFIDYLRYRSVKLVPRMNLIFWLLTAAIVLSTSRLGWSIMVVWASFRLFWHVKERGIVIPWKPIAVAGMVLAILITGLASHYHLAAEDLSFLGTGIGILGATETHSTDTRIETAVETLNVFFQHPIIGVSLGGVATALGNNRNSSILGVEAAKENEGICVTAEVLAASGIIGFIPFVLYMYNLMWTPLNLSDTSEIGICVKALTWSLIMVFIALQFSPTILRAPFWLHIAILSCAYRVCCSTQKVRRYVAALGELRRQATALG
jgi:hypothetical protein